jgi:tetratricopeptide (TPR) repeat protein
MTTVSKAPEPEATTPEPPERPVELALARAHLRLGSLALARVELEILARRGALDLPGRVDLAEARWRTGDLAAAGEAANAALSAGEEAPVALVIAAEAAAALGRPNEARRLAGRVIDRTAGPIDALFAGMPRSAVWPADAAEPPPTPGTLFHHEPGPAPNRRAGDVDPGVVAARGSASDDRRGSTTATTLTLGFWDADRDTATSVAALPDPGSELEAARAALRAGSNDEAVLRFALALRLAPALAPAILEATDGLGGPAISVVRGDAYRLVGLESEAKRAYAAAAWSGPRDRRGRWDGTSRRSAAAAPVDPEIPPTTDAGSSSADAEAPPADAEARWGATGN